jgi:hypothetical protein
MDTTLFAFAALALIFAAILYAAFKSAWRILHADSRLRLRQMLRVQGADPQKVLEAGTYQVAQATRRCVACRDKDACDAWFAAGGPGSAERFCPNAEFVRHAVREY